MAWKLISSIYEAGWDSLVADNHKNTFRQKVSHKFTSQVNLEKPGKKQKTPANKPASIGYYLWSLQNLLKRLMKSRSTSRLASPPWQPWTRLNYMLNWPRTSATLRKCWKSKQLSPLSRWPTSRTSRTSKRSSRETTTPNLSCTSTWPPRGHCTNKSLFP